MITAITFLVLGAVAVDADTFKTQTPWGLQYFRVWGLDGIERYDFQGDLAKLAMAELVEDHLLECEIKGFPSYNRQVVQCFNEDGVDLACEQMEQGWGQEYLVFSLGAYDPCTKDPS